MPSKKPKKSADVKSRGNLGTPPPLKVPAEPPAPKPKPEPPAKPDPLPPAAEAKATLPKRLWSWLARVLGD